MEKEIWEVECVTRRKGKESGKAENIQIVIDVHCDGAMQTMSQDNQDRQIGWTLVRWQMLASGRRTVIMAK